MDQEDKSKIEKINPLRLEKERKRKDLLKKDISLYPHIYEKTHSCLSILKEYKKKDISEEDSKKEFFVAGRLMRKRDMGKAAFFNIQDEGVELQCYLKKDQLRSKDLWDVWKLLDIGDIIGITGHLFRTKKGELSLRVFDFQILCKTIEILPEKYHGLEDKELKYRYRHLDLIMNPKSREIFLSRSRIISEIRNYMNQKGFVEVETPILQPIYGGAIAAPFVTHHKRLERELFLKISPELYLKKLIVGGIEKVYEIGKNFRNEGIDRTHNPEFTMMEYYEAYTDYNYQMNQFEDLILHIVEKISGGKKISYQGKEIDFSIPWKRISVYDSLKEKGFYVDQLNHQDLVKKIKSLDSNVNGKDLDKSRGELIMHLFELTVEPHIWNPTFIIDFPKEVSPLTKNHRHLEGLVERFEPIVAGMEIGNAYTELNDPVDQKERLLNQERMREKDDTAHPMDENFIHSIEIGMPPTGGVGLGIERLIMILTDQSSIKDVILFPILKTKN